MSDITQCYRELALEVIRKAILDYRKALHKLHRNPNNYRAKNSIREVERFFYSDLFEMMSDANPEALIKEIKLEVEKEQTNG